MTYRSPLPCLESPSPGSFWGRFFGLTQNEQQERGELFETEFTLEQVVSVLDRLIRLEELEETATSRAAKCHLVQLLQEMGVPNPKSEAIVINRALRG